jgi:hypothetical protein
MYTIYLDDNDTDQVTINCRNCGLEHIIDITKFKDTEKKLEGKCKCGVPYRYNIEVRQRYREDVNLPGEYNFPGIDHKEGIILRELSFTGIQFESLNSHKIAKDDLLEIKFKLDNRLGSEIRKLVKVIWVEGHIIGGIFIETKLFEEELKSYLQILE